MAGMLEMRSTVLCSEPYSDSNLAEYWVNRMAPYWALDLVFGSEEHLVRWMAKRLAQQRGKKTKKGLHFQIYLAESKCSESRWVLSLVLN